MNIAGKFKTRECYYGLMEHNQKIPWRKVIYDSEASPCFVHSMASLS